MEGGLWELGPGSKGESDADGGALTAPCGSSVLETLAFRPGEANAEGGSPHPPREDNFFCVYISRPKSPAPRLVWIDAEGGGTTLPGESVARIYL